MNANLLKGIAIGFVLACLASVGTGDYDQAKKDSATYCKNVKDGVWPDYKKIFDKRC